MTDVRTTGRSIAASSRAGPVPGAHESRVSRYFLLWVLAAPFVGFALAGRVLDLGAEGDWELWESAVMGVVLMAPFGFGAAFGLRAVRKGFRGGWVGLLGNLGLAVLAIGMPVAESLSA